MDENLRLIVESALRVHGDCGGCVEWSNEKTERRIRSELGPFGLTPEGVKRLAIEHVRAWGTVQQRREERPHLRDVQDYWYFVVVPDVEFMPRGLFIEFVLIDEDPDLPTIHIVNAHRQSP